MSEQGAADDDVGLLEPPPAEGIHTVKRALVGRPMATDAMEETLLRKRLALPIFASDALSSVAYATESALIVLLAAGPQLVGHSSYNWALKYFSATMITVTILAEPVGATVLAIPILGQVPAPISLAGGALILVGIYLAARGESQ